MLYIVAVSTKILTLEIAPFLYISVGALSKFAIVPDVYISSSPQKEEVYSFFLI